MIHNQLTLSAELLNGIASAAGLDRNADGVLRLGETLEPNIDPWSLPEWAFLRGERIGAGKAFFSAVAAEFPILAFGNASGSGNLVVIESLSALSGTAGTTIRTEVAADTAVAATLSAQAFMGSGRDRRWGATAGRFFQRAGTDPGSTFGAQLEQRVSIAGQYVQFQETLPIVLKPGDDLLVIGLTVNTTLDANVKWRERKAFSGELTP